MNSQSARKTIYLNVARVFDDEKAAKGLMQERVWLVRCVQEMLSSKAVVALFRAFHSLDISTRVLCWRPKWLQKGHYTYIIIFPQSRILYCTVLSVGSPPYRYRLPSRNPTKAVRGSHCRLLTVGYTVTYDVV